MKKLLSVILASVCLLSLVGCSQNENDISKYLKKKDGDQYLILPISKEEICVWDEEKAKYLIYVDVDMLKTAENRIAKKVSQYDDDTPCYYIDIRDGYLCLAVELIVEFDTRDENGMDHEHVFFRERITKKPVTTTEE